MNEVIEVWKPEPGSRMAAAASERAAAAAEIQRLSGLQQATREQIQAARALVQNAGPDTDVDDLAQAMARLPALEHLLRVQASAEGAARQTKRKKEEVLRWMDAELTEKQNNMNRLHPSWLEDARSAFDEAKQRLTV